MLTGSARGALPSVGHHVVPCEVRAGLPAASPPELMAAGADDVVLSAPAQRRKLIATNAVHCGTAAQEGRYRRASTL